MEQLFLFDMGTAKLEQWIGNVPVELVKNTCGHCGAELQLEPVPDHCPHCGYRLIGGKSAAEVKRRWEEFDERVRRMDHITFEIKERSE